MARPLFLRYRLLLVLVGGLLLLGCGAAVASAVEPYGELTHFGSAGTGKGQFQIPPETHDYAFGADPTDNTLYVGDEPTSGEYRVQKLGPKGEFLASVSFKPANPIALEGIAVDAAKERIYVLAVALRGNGAIDPGTSAAGTLYAFKTKASGEKLESAVSGASTEAKEGVLANPAALETESETQGHALLEPSGIAVDPTTHDVIIMGVEDRGASQMRDALQRVSETGGLGARYVDTTDCFGGKGSVECAEGGAKEPSSPAVSQAGKVYAESFDQIWEVPSDFTSVQPPKLFIPFISFAEVQTGPVQELVEFPGAPAPSAGGGLALAPEGTIYVGANIKHNSPTKTGEFKYPGALAFTAAGAETGWTGGQSKASGGGKCTISFLQSPSLAAGKEGDLFVLNAAAPDVVEFGPGGTGCPAARASVPSMTLKGQAVTGPVPAGSKVTLSSTVEQGNALSVAWNFGDGESETVGTNEFQVTKVTHTFTQPGEHTITETIHTDDLQTPEITVTGKLQVEGEEIKEAVKITAQPIAQAVEEGKTATFTAAASGIPARD
jgi:PKD domain